MVFKYGMAFEKLMQVLEGVRPRAYPDIDGKWTIGIGHLIEDYDANLKQILETYNYNPETLMLTAEQIVSLFELDAQERIHELNDLVGDLLDNQCQFDALLSFIYNVGINDLKKSHMLGFLKQKDYVSASKEFLKFIHDSKGRVVPSLYKRRIIEKAIFDIMYIDLSQYELDEKTKADIKATLDIYHDHIEA